MRKTIDIQAIINRPTKSYYRWIVLGIIFVLYTIATADRANFGMALPFIKQEFNLTNSESGLLISFFFTFYALGQIPCGFIYRKFSVRTVMPIAMILTSISTWLVGHTSSLFWLKVFRISLGLSEAPLGIGCGTTINNWFPPREKGTAMGFYFAAMKCGPVIVPPICALIIVWLGWRALFIACAIPGIIIAVFWYFYVHNKPEESRFVSEAELKHIRSEEVSSGESVVALKDNCPKWIDVVIRRKKLPAVDTTFKIFKSWNIIGSGLSFMCMSGIINTIMAWIPSYLMSEKGFSTINTGFMAAAPFIGAVLGNMVGGVLSDRVFFKRRKPMMIVSAISTSVMMYALVYAPNNPFYLSTMLFLMGFLLNLGYSAFVVYPMALATKAVYPLAYSVVNTGGSVGAALVPFVVGVILDMYSWDVAFMFLASCSVLALFIILTLNEPNTNTSVAT